MCRKSTRLSGHVKGPGSASPDQASRPWQFTERFEVRDDAMCQIHESLPTRLKHYTRINSLTVSCTRTSPSPLGLLIPSNHPLWCVPNRQTCSHKLTSQTERAIQLGLAAINVNTQRPRPVRRLCLTVTTSSSPTQCLPHIIRAHHRRIRQACQTGARTNKGRKGVRAAEELPK
jgi:hypothetical protein